MTFDRPGISSTFLPAEADWGIEEASHFRKRFDSVSTSEYSQPPRIKEYSMRSPTLCNRSSSSIMGSDSFHLGTTSQDSLKHQHLRPGLRHEFHDNSEGLKIKASTENFHKYITKYLSLGPIRSLLIERFKYNLMLSNLLDNSLVLSKNEQALERLQLGQNSEDHFLPLLLKKGFGDDGIRLKLIHKKYVLLIPAPLQHNMLLFNTIGLLIFLLKQTQKISSYMRLASRIKLFKLLLITSTWILKSKRAQATIESSRSLKSLDSFMISNCKINKVIIAHMIKLKEFDLFSFLNKGPAPVHPAGSSVYSKTLKKHLDTLLTCLILNLQHSIRELLPYTDGVMLEKYCQINNIQASALYETAESEHADALTLETLTTKLAAFNNHRRFLVCQLLTVHECHSHNFFLLTLSDHLNIDLSVCLTFYTASHKAAKLEEVFQTHTGTLDQLFALNEKFKTLQNSLRTSDYANDDVLATRKLDHEGGNSDDVFALDSDADLNILIDKLLGMVSSLRYFKKYSRMIATLDNADEHEERLSIFNLFYDDLKTCLGLFSTCVGDFKADFQAKFNPATSGVSSRSNSQHNSRHSENNFNLKSFRTLSSKSRKAHAIPSPGQPLSSLENTVLPNKDDKRFNRASSGLQLGLLTVLEDSLQAVLSPGDITLSLRHGFESHHGSYNLAALEALTKKANVSYPSARFSTTSNISGISDLIASAQITTDEDDGENPSTECFSGGATQNMTKIELTKKLEESFARIYNLEIENLELKCKTPTSESTKASLCFEDNQDQCNATKDTEFLRNLEQSLSSKSGIRESE